MPAHKGFYLLVFVFVGLHFLYPLCLDDKGHKFDKALWNEKDAHGNRYYYKREKMVADLINNHLHIGMCLDSVNNLLGESDYASERDISLESFHIYSKIKYLSPGFFKEIGIYEMENFKMGKIYFCALYCFDLDDCKLLNLFFGKDMILKAYFVSECNKDLRVIDW